MTTVITYGTFDLLHYGHLNLLKRASQLGNRLIVGVSSDDFVKSKGKEAVFSCEKRMEYISDLKYVSEVIPEYSMQQKVEDIKKYHVDIFVLGDDYAESFLRMPEYEQIKDLCQVVFLPRTPSISTTRLKTLR
jgi:glycerol-3-phosphate cytidylyltransferase